MWCLESPKGEVYKITPGRVHTVSRKNGDIILANDQSVSRKHAYLEVLSPVTEGVNVWDDSSKYGTFVNEGITNDRKLTAGCKTTIKEGAKVRFGLQEMNIWTLKKDKLCVCAHMLKPSEKSQVKSVLNRLGYKLVDGWVKDTTHLTTNYLRLSYEVLLALASAKPIVLPEFWQHYTNMMTGEGACPDPAKFMPPLEDSSLLKTRKACLPNLARKTLFLDKTFIFSSSQSFNLYKTVVETAGGKALKMSDCGFTLSNYCKPNVVVLNCEEGDQTSFYNKVLSTLLDKNLRIIPVEDIGLALWKVSTAVHCNPSHSANSILRRSNDFELDAGATLVDNTEDVDAASTGISVDDRVIPPTLTEDTHTDDATMSMSVRATEKTSPASVAGPSRKRTRENSNERKNTKGNTASPGKISIKIETEEEDIFADEYSRPSTSNNSSSTHFKSTTTDSSSTPLNNISNNILSTRFKNSLYNSVAKEENKPTDDDSEGFQFHSPPKKKKLKHHTEEEDEADMFALPKAPSPTKSNVNEKDEDELDFLSTSKLSKSSKAAKQNFLEESKDMFETQDLTSTASASTRGGKRKERGESESESPPFKKPSKACLDVTNVPSSHKHSTTTSGFLSKNNNSQPKTEVKDDPNEDKDETELSNRLCAKVVITPLLRKPQVNGLANSSTNTNAPIGKNFKKFRKAWSGSTTKHYITTSSVRTGNRHTLDSTGQGDDEDEDDPFIPSHSRSRPRPAAHRQNGRRNNVDDDDEDEDEFALPTYSQCM